MALLRGWRLLQAKGEKMKENREALEFLRAKRFTPKSMFRTDSVTKITENVAEIQGNRREQSRHMSQ